MYFRKYHNHNIYKCNHFLGEAEILTQLQRCNAFVHDFKPPTNICDLIIKCKINAFSYLTSTSNLKCRSDSLFANNETGSEQIKLIIELNFHKFPHIFHSFSLGLRHMYNSVKQSFNLKTAELVSRLWISLLTSHTPLTPPPHSALMMPSKGNGKRVYCLL